MAISETFYEDQAKACGEAAGLAELDNQRAKFLAAQRAWQALADQSVKIQIERDARLAEARARAEAQV